MFTTRTFVTITVAAALIASGALLLAARDPGAKHPGVRLSANVTTTSTPLPPDALAIHAANLAALAQMCLAAQHDPAAADAFRSAVSAHADLADLIDPDCRVRSARGTTEAGGRVPPPLSVYGDSLTAPATSQVMSLSTHTAAVTIHAFPGTSLPNWDADIRASRPSRLVLALGTNDAAGQGIDPWRDLLSTLPPSTCIAWPRAFPWSPQVAAFDAQMGSLIARFRNVHVIDWASRVLAHPEWVLPDHIHYDADGTAAYAAMLQDAIQTCAT